MRKQRPRQSTKRHVFKGRRARIWIHISLTVRPEHLAAMLYFPLSWEASNRRILAGIIYVLISAAGFGSGGSAFWGMGCIRLEHAKWASLNIWRVGLPSGTVWRHKSTCLPWLYWFFLPSQRSLPTHQEARPNSWPFCFYHCLYPVKEGVSFTPNCCLASIWTGSICLCHSVGIAISFFKLPPRLSCLQYKFQMAWNSSFMASARLNI